MEGQTAVKVKKKKLSPRKRACIIMTIALSLLLLAEIYYFLMFTNIPFIKNWRDIYIETAMDTFTHKWLATTFIPKSVIDEVMARKDEVIKEQQELKSTWEDEAKEPKETPVPIDNSRTNFLRIFYELDAVSFDAYIKEHPELLSDGYDKLYINEAGLDDAGTSIKTHAGDQVLAIDAEHGLLIVNVTGEGYVGKLAIVRDPSTVGIGLSAHLGSYGQTVKQIAKNNNAVLAINASGFADYEGVGNGGTVVGLLIANGKKYADRVSGTYLNIGFDWDNRLYIGASESEVDYRDAVQFVPALIVNGENIISKKKLVNGSMGFGLQPRTVIGQQEDGSVLLLTIDGRQVGYSVGCTVVECAVIMERYDAVQAANLDGGSSTVMVYRGEEITKPANGIAFGRYVPDAIIVGTLSGDGRAAANRTPSKPSNPSPKPEVTTPASPSPDPRTVI
jgi:exopolysaccharide biosynthesis protein